MTEVQQNLPGLKIFRQNGCVSYLLFDSASREAVIIDPLVELMDDFRSFLGERGLRPQFAIDTHLHADHYSATSLFQAEYKSEIGMAASTQSGRVTRRLKHGDEIRAGAITLKVLETPGHTADSLSFYGQGFVFTGDTLLISSSGRTDFATSDPIAQWKSLKEVLAALPPETLVFPGHDYNDLLFSTIETEKKKNPHLLMSSREEFVAMKRSESVPAVMGEVKKRVDFNMQAAPGSCEGFSGTATSCANVSGESLSSVSSINVRKYAEKLHEKAPDSAFIDVREPGEYQESHIAGTASIPLSEVAFALSDLRKSKRVYISCLSGRRSMTAAKTLSYLGFQDVVNVTGGIRAWTKEELPVQTK